MTRSSTSNGVKYVMGWDGQLEGTDITKERLRLKGLLTR